MRQYYVDNECAVMSKVNNKCSKCMMTHDLLEYDGCSGHVLYGSHRLADGDCPHSFEPLKVPLCVSSCETSR